MDDFTTLLEVFPESYFPFSLMFLLYPIEEKLMSEENLEELS